MSHKFKAGQQVTFTPSQYRLNGQATFKVVLVLPAEHGINQYRLKSTLDGRERVAMEHELG